MQIHNFQLSYCSNIHPGETWDATFENLKIYIPEVKNRLKHKGPFGIGLRLSHEASLILERPERMQEFQEWLKKTNAYVFTLNCFPYGGFHRTKVKENVHTPDWTTAERKEYTIRSFRILAQLLPEGMEGGISTSPLSYRHWFSSEKKKNEAIDKSTDHLIEVVEELVKIHQETGKLLHLDIEPEPDGILENSDELISYFQNWLLPKGKVALAEKLGVSTDEAEKLIKTHIQACYDVCHFAIVYENPADTFQKFRYQGGIGAGLFGHGHVAEQLLGKAHALFRAFLHLLLGQFGDTRFHGMGAMGQAAVVGDLDVQAGAGVEFENQRALVYVQHHVDTDIAQATQLVATGGQLHKAVPVG